MMMRTPRHVKQAPISAEHYLRDQYRDEILRQYEQNVKQNTVITDNHECTHKSQMQENTFTVTEYSHMPESQGQEPSSKTSKTRK